MKYDEMKKCREIAAQIWCDPRVSDREMDAELAEVIAEELFKLNKPHLGLATTDVIINELKARIEIHGPGLEYRTVDGD